MAKYIARSCRRCKSWRLALVLIFTLVAGTAVSASLARAAQEQLPNVTVASKKPNIIFVLADDLSTELMDHLPRLRSLLADQGTTVSNFFVSLALCCPSRASILRGQYAHNTQIFTNAPPGGGFEKFRNLGHEKSTVATWLRDGGYRTVLLGKYLNGYPLTTHVPPGWDEWYGVAGGINFFNYTLNENGDLVRYGGEPKAYLTDVFA